ncbi:hypothetical protein [Mesobacterium pallidum]|uniref:hypothetical protein n=1 Tax=Mesobacterium pallidum TaxID=2872037 RepID=UPI001EE1D46A|nr:hypothetical protein [Mesobacterium pallidum]
MTPRPYPFRALLFALGATLALAPRPAVAAEPRPLVMDVSEVLTYVGPSGITNHSDVELSLCRLALQGRVLMLPVWRRNSGYALAEGQCRAARYLPLPPEELVAAQRTGLLPAALPAKPPLTLGDRIAGFWGLAVIGALTFLMWRLPRRWRARSRAHQRLKGLQG